MKQETFDKSIEKRFKILSLFAFHLGVWEDKMQELADAIDGNHPNWMEALNFYEDKIIEVMSAPDKQPKEKEKKVEPVFTHFTKNDAWVHGTFGEYQFGAKLFDIGSVFGINKGRVSKLSISHPDCNCVVNYERGWDVKPTKEHAKAYRTILKFLESAPQRLQEENEVKLSTAN